MAAGYEPLQYAHAFLLCELLPLSRFHDRLIFVREINDTGTMYLYKMCGPWLQQFLMV